MHCAVVPSLNLYQTLILSAMVVGMGCIQTVYVAHVITVKVGVYTKDYSREPVRVTLRKRARESLDGGLSTIPSTDPDPKRSTSLFPIPEI